MELVYPGTSKVIWMVGLIFTGVGSTNLALMRTLRHKKRRKRRVSEEMSDFRFGKNLLRREGQISESRDEDFPDKDPYSGLRDSLLSMSNRGEYRITDKPEMSIETIRLDSSDEIIDEIVFEYPGDLPWGVPGNTTWRTQMSIDDLDDEFDGKFESRLVSLKDSETRTAWAIFAFGVLLQFLGFFSEHFVAW